MTPVIYIVIPCYNEEEVLRETALRLEIKLSSLIKNNLISDSSRILFVDDRSTDNTWGIISRLHDQNSLFCGIRLSHNKGHQNALFAGLTSVYYQNPDAVISMDADLQDDINAIDSMIEDFKNGSEIVYGVRSDRTSDTFFKKYTAESFYKIMDGMGIETVFNHADYRLLSKRALNSLLEYKESNLFLRGIIPQLGYKTSKVEYVRSERFAGESKYPFKKMLSLAWEGITSFSTKPLTAVIKIGSIFTGISFLGILALIILTCCSVNFNETLWIIAAIIFMGGIQLLSVGIIGQYVGKSYIETKQRPRFIIDKELY